MAVVNSTVWVILLSFGWQAFAHQPQDGDVHAFLGPALLRTQRSSLDFTSPFMGGIALGAEGDIDDNGGLEILMMYMPYVSSIKRSGQVISEKVQRMYVSTGYRSWLGPRLSGYLGFFSAFSMGDPTIIQNDFGVTHPMTSASDTTEYGFDASIQYEPLRRGRYSLIIDARYAYSVTPKPQENENFYSIIFGIKYFVQSREDELPKH